MLFPFFRSLILGKRRCLGAGLWNWDCILLFTCTARNVWHGMESLVLYTTQRPCNWKTRCFKFYPLIRDTACMFLLEPAIDFHLRIIGRPIEYMPSDFVSLCSFHPSARGSTYLDNDSATQRNTSAEKLETHCPKP